MVKLKTDITLSPHMRVARMKEFGKRYNKIVKDFDFPSHAVPYSRKSKKDIPDMLKKWKHDQKLIGNFISKRILANDKNKIIKIFKKEYEKTPDNKFLLVSYENGNGQFVTKTVNEKMLSYIKHFIETGKSVDTLNEYGSDVDVDQYFMNYTTKDFTFSRKNKHKINQNGNYFNYLNGTSLDLSKLQIYNKEQYEKKLKTGINNCVIHSLKAFDIPKEIINKIKNITQHYKSSQQDKAIINDAFISRHFDKIAQVIEKNILLKKFYNHPKVNPLEWIYNMEQPLFGSDMEFIERNMKVYKYKHNPELLRSNNTIKTETISICLYKNHFMPNIELDINNFVVKNYTNIKDIKGFMDFTRMRGKKYSKEKNKQIKKANTADVIRMLENHKQRHEGGNYHLYYKDEILTKHIQYKEDNSLYLNGEGEQHEIIDEARPRELLHSNNTNKSIFFADCETYPKCKALFPYAVGVVGMENDDVIITETVEKFLDHIVNNTNKDDLISVYFHNAKFDYSVMFKNFMKESPTVKNGQFYKGVIRYRERRIVIKDSMKHINLALSKFKNAYKLNVGKKDLYMPYSLYNQETVKQKSVSYDLLKLKTSTVPSEQLEYDNIADIEKLDSKEKEECIEPYCYITASGNKRFRHMEFMETYLESDCLTLKHGFLRHRENIFKLCDAVNVERLDIFDILTTSSLSYLLYMNVGTYDRVFELSGNKRRFIQKSIIGGRVSTKGNGKHMSKFVMDYDACSLYPSAIYRLKKEYGGIPAGEAKNILNFDDIKNSTYYVAEIKVNNIQDNQQISFFNFLDSKGTRRYSGNYKEFRENVNDGKIIVDRITLEDYVKYQHMEYEFIQGLYWDEFNPIMSDMTYKLYDLRTKYKNTKINGQRTEEAELMQSTTKLILNSIYGKTLLKPATEKIVTKPNKKVTPYKITEEYEMYGKTQSRTMWARKLNGELKNRLDDNGNEIFTYPAEMYLSKNYNIINHIVEEDLVTTFHINHNDFDDKNSCHVGGMILSMSKRIMNEVMDLANTLKIEVLYCDTDSLHIPKKYIEQLEKEFKIVFGRSLRGENLGEFHNDLESKFGGDVMFNCVSEECIILGKKAYLDVLIIDEDCLKNKKLIEYKKLNMEELKTKKEYHIRLKGVGSFAFKRNFKDIVGAYKDLYNNKTLEFDLTKGSVKFQISNMNNIIQKDNFKRNVSFK